MNWLAHLDVKYGDSIENIAAALGGLSIAGLWLIATYELIAEGVL